MEITLLEDPACSWCWAFEPVLTTLQFEILSDSSRRGVRFRRVMGGLRDRPPEDPSFCARQWKRAAELSGMPFSPAIWDRHVLRTTFEASRAVKAASTQGGNAADRLLRRIRAAFYVEEMPIDDREVLLTLARGEGLDHEALQENLSNGRAESLFERDRREAAEHRFGFPTLLLRKHPNDAPVALNGKVGYQEVLDALQSLGYEVNERRRFLGRPEDWERLFEIHPRLTLAELSHATRLDGEPLEQSCARNGVQADGPFYARSPLGFSRDASRIASRICSSFSSTERLPPDSPAGNRPPG